MDEPRTSTDAQGCQTCPTCRQYTFDGRRQREVNYRDRPIYQTDFTKPTGEIIEEVRHVLAQARGTLTDIGYADSFWKERVEAVEGLLTCGLVTLYAAIQEAPDAAKRSLLPTAHSVQ